jgi:gliding motility-associated-like protein
MNSSNFKVLLRNLLWYLVPVLTLQLAFETSHAQTITHFEYFVDTDPGPGLGAGFNPSSPGTVVTNVTVSVPVNSLSVGYHTIYVRGQNSSGAWTETIFYKFFIVPPPVASTNLVQMEYFIDADPGFGLATQATGFTSGPAINNLAIPINLGSLSAGIHSLFVRAKDAGGMWTQTYFSKFFVAPLYTTTNLVKFEYFFDSDPGFNNGTPVPVTPPSITVTNQLIAVIPASLAVGDHILFIRGEDAAGGWTTIVSQTITVSAPTGCGVGAPNVTPGAGCANSAITLTAAGATGTQQYRWYDVATGGTSLSSLATYAPVVAATTTYYVSIFDQTGNCEGPRNSVVATITPPPGQPVVTPGGPLSFCSGGNVSLSAPTGYSGYLWSDANTSQTRTVATTATLTVQVADATGCQSVPSDPIIVTVFALPAKPTITGSHDICNGKTVTLTGPDGFTYQWSDGEVEQMISVSQASTITLIVTDANSCSSPASDPFVLACTNVKPVIQDTTLATYLHGEIILPLLSITKDADNNLNPASFTVVSANVPEPHVSIDANFNLILNYAGIDFTGTDHLTITACDLDDACVSQELDVDVAGDITIYNGLSPNGDKKNDFFFIQYIEVLPDTKVNKVTIYNRWGDVVFDVENYDNATNVFRGVSNAGDMLPTGTYFYKITFSSNRKERTGYVSLKN